MHSLILKSLKFSFSFPCAAVFASSLSFTVVFAYEEFQEVLLKIKVILYDVCYFIQLLHLPKGKSRNNITYCVWLLVFVEFLMFEVSLCNILFVMWMVLVQFDVWEVILMESALEVDLASSSMLEQQYELACSL